MNQEVIDNLETRLSSDHYQKILKINNPKVNDFINKFIEICNPEKIYVCTDSEEDIKYTRDAAIKNHEEAKLSIKGHTIHFDGFYDQARDKNSTKFLIPKNKNLGPEFNAIDRDEGLKEIYQIL
ncbi:MAG: phosphoenolpyruvate carboxykinase (GTP), partial [Thermoplasmatota archaeon]